MFPFWVSRRSNLSLSRYPKVRFRGTATRVSPDQKALITPYARGAVRQSE